MLPWAATSPAVKYVNSRETGEVGNRRAVALPGALEAQLTTKSLEFSEHTLQGLRHQTAAWEEK